MSCDCAPERMYSPSPTVSAPRVPLYLQGGTRIRTMGQDDTSAIDWSMPNPTVPDFSLPDMGVPDVPMNLPTVDLPTTFPQDPNAALIQSGFSPEDAATIADLSSKGWLSQSDWNDLVAGNVTASELAAINYRTSSALEQAANVAAGTSKAVAAAVPKPASSQKATPKSTQLPPGPSPRVATSTPGTNWFTQSSMISSVPNWAVLAGVALILGSGFLGKFSGPSVARPKIRYKPYIADNPRRRRR